MFQTDSNENRNPEDRNISKFMFFYKKNIRDEAMVRKTGRIESTSFDQSRLEINTGKRNTRKAGTSS